MSEGETHPRSDQPRVILAPEVVGGLWLDAACAALFEAWRDGQLRPVVNRDLLMRYARLWRALGLPAVQVRRWSWWFTSPAKAWFLADDRSASSNVIECCVNLAILSGAACAIHRGIAPAPEGEVRWLTASDFLRPN